MASGTTIAKGMATSGISVVSGAPAEPPPGVLWRASVRNRALLVEFAEPFSVLSWAPFGGGFRQARAIANIQIPADNRVATGSPALYARNFLRQQLEVDPKSAIAMMTGAHVSEAGLAMVSRADLAISAWCTAGFSNALCAGDPGTAGIPDAGTINLIVAINQPLSNPAFVEAIQIATEARVLAVQEAGVISTRTRRIATGTGTDCIAIAAPALPLRHSYCGKHTVLGEMLAKAVIRASRIAIRRALRR